MRDRERLSLEQIGAFLEGSEEVEFAARNQSEVYQWTERILVNQEYLRLPRSGKGTVRQYIRKMTGRSRAQVARLISQFLNTAR